MEQSKRKFKVLKFQPFDGAHHFKIESLDVAGDVYHECSDGWFENRRTDSRKNILNMDDRNEYFEDISDQPEPDNVFFEHQFDSIPTGLFIVFWKYEGISVASIGKHRDGSKWIAPTNWTSAVEQRPSGILSKQNIWKLELITTQEQTITEIRKRS